MDRAFDFGSKGCRFKSCRARQQIQGFARFLRFRLLLLYHSFATSAARSSRNKKSRVATREATRPYFNASEAPGAMPPRRCLTFTESCRRTEAPAASPGVLMLPKTPGPWQPDGQGACCAARQSIHRPNVARHDPTRGGWRNVGSSPSKWLSWRFSSARAWPAFSCRDSHRGNPHLEAMSPKCKISTGASVFLPNAPAAPSHSCNGPGRSSSYQTHDKQAEEAVGRSFWRLVILTAHWAFCLSCIGEIPTGGRP